MSVQEALKLGAYDLKKYANRNLGIAFLVAMFIFILLFSIPTIFAAFNKAGEAGEDLTFSGPVTLEDFVEEDELEAQENEVPPEEIVPPPPPPMAADMPQGTGSVGAAGQFEATTEEFEGPSVADMSEINFAREGGGEGGFNPDDFGDLGDMDVDLKKREENVSKAVTTSTDPYPEFLPNAEKPKYSESDLVANTVYPVIASQEGLEGTVHVKVNIDKMGKVQKVSVARSTSEIFNQSALEAVRKTTFSPAVQNGYPVAMAITIPVKFKLND